MFENPYACAGRAVPHMCWQAGFDAQDVALNGKPRPGDPAAT
jgi:hypothetical protein